MKDDQYLTTDEVLAYLQVNLRTVYRLVKSGQLPAVRVGRQWRFYKSDIRKWLGRRRGPAVPPGLRPRILVVDDEVAVRDMVAKALAPEYHVDIADDGPSALERLREAEYDLLITDLKMPGMDGLTVIREALRRNETMPVVIITGASTEASAIEAVNLGVRGYLTKPFRVSRILDVAARAMAEPQARPAL